MIAGATLAGDSLIDTGALRETLSLMQHHDAVTGTATQNTIKDYQKRMKIGTIKYSNLIRVLVRSLTDHRFGLDLKNFSLCSFPALWKSGLVDC